MEERLKRILEIALSYNVTDIHFSADQRNKNNVTVEMRVNGKMKRLKPESDDLKLFFYLMYRANLDVSDTLNPQTGSMQEKVGKQILSLRFAVVSSYHIISGVLRILNNHSTLKIDDLTVQKEAVEWMKSITRHRSGLFIFSGPTGSGKTTSLYTILNECEGKKIFTLEDPVEVVSEHYVQLQINDKQHLSYAEGIKQLMRHDPDIIMIGEIRDDTAARMAVRSSLTGHLVVTSIHSSSCISAVHRMLDLGVEQYQLQDVLRGVSNQRLYESCKGNKTGVYEIMTGKDLHEYFEKGKASLRFRTIEENIKLAVSNGIVSESQAAADLIA
jgi:competence protein ComGA